MGQGALETMQSMRALLGHAIDYAGLFPPASLDLEHSLDNYAAYRSGKDAWALGSQILPVSALMDFEMRSGTGNVPVSVVLGPQPEQDLQDIARRSMQYQLFECRLSDAGRIAPIMKEVPANARIFFEVDARTSSPDILSVIHETGASAKIRTGGIVESAIPSPRDVTRFVAECARLRLPFKATAGLHHPLRNQYGLTYEKNPPIGTMHGFLNVIFAAALLYLGASTSDACAVLEETDLLAFSVSSDSLRWHGCEVTAEQMLEVRKHFFTGFGSCSFVEPIEQSRALGWII